MKSLQQHLPVHLIATPRKDFRMCRHDESIEDVLERNIERFDHFPVIRHGRNHKNHIVGLIELTNLEMGKVYQGKVEKYMSPLSEENLIAAETGILDFVKSADTQPCRLLVTATGIEGLVSISDLQQLPVRAALFALITHVEMIMAEVIRRQFTTDTAWIDKVQQDARSKLENRIKKARKNNNEVDPLHMTLFSDKINIILSLVSFSKKTDTLKNDLNELRDLRNKLAHANEYAADRRSARRICIVVQKAKSCIQQFHDWLGNDVAIN